LVSTNWLDYREWKAEHTVSGTVMVLPEMWSPQLENERAILVYLPASHHETNRRYPVIYMHDGQNLFDAMTSFTGEWYVDETMQTLEQEGIEAIIVGIPNIGEERLNEYSPFRQGRMGGGRGDQYLDFIVQTVKPLIDDTFFTQPEREYTGILGSSMGGLISLYAFFNRPQIFGMVGAMSPAFWFGQRAIFPYVQNAAYLPGKIYLDAGTQEARGRQLISRKYAWSVAGAAQEMRDILVRKGYRDGENVLYVEEDGAPHHESAWARRLPDALRWLLG
jgi:predicted alpha/beta superfamily hydrolase